jgi:hypothetical protein
MAKLKVIKHEVLNNRLLVTVEVDKWWAKPYTRQFIESGYSFTKHPNKDNAWLTYPEFQILGWVGGEGKYHDLLTGWKKGYDFQKDTKNV